MIASEIQDLLTQALPDAVHVAVEGEGGKFTVTVVHPDFADLRPVARQQRIYAPLQPHISSGVIHAVSMRTHTPEEWRRISLFN